MNNRKRVLIVNSHSIKENNSTGLTLRSIVDFFKNEDVLEVYYFPITKHSGWNEIQSLKLENNTKFIYNLITKVYKGKIKNDITEKIVEDEINNKPSLLKKTKNIILAYDDVLEPKIEYNQDILNKISEFKPEVVYTLGASIFSLNLAYYFSGKYNIPIVLHHMDNWRETTYSKLPFGRYPRKKLLHLLEKVESRMNYGMTISDEMASKYEQITGRNYLSLMHTVQIDNMSLRKTKIANTVNFAYAGGLHLERWKVLKDIEKAIKELKITNKKVCLNIFTTQSDKAKYEDQFDEYIVKFHDYLPHNEVYKIYDLADILVHVESFDPEIINFTKFSLSTKIPEYLASGRPILCYAPMNIASSKYILNSKSGLSVSNYTQLIDATKRLIEDENLREEMGKNGVDTALKKHSQEYKSKIMNKVFELEG
jgi:glycosyltransferase involved in cell wall biosynthesis